MSKGIALTDEDRLPWLQALARYNLLIILVPKVLKQALSFICCLESFGHFNLILINCFSMEYSKFSINNFNLEKGFLFIII